MAVCAGAREASRYPVDWTNVRGVYKKLQTDFHLLTDPFGIVVPDDRNVDLSHLICAIDVVDRNLDRIENALDRQQFMTATLDFLRGNVPLLQINDGSKELMWRMDCLREIVARLGIAEEFCDTVKAIVDHGEAKRLANSEDEMIAHLVEEWRLTGMLPVLVLGELSTPAFERFFFHCCATMPAIDMLQDARMDYRNGQISIRPTFRLHWKLLKILLSGLPRLLRHFPKPLTLFRYAFSFIWEGITRRPEVGDPMVSTP